MSQAPRKILFIDDEENILSALRRVFRASGLEIHFVTEPEEAFRLVSEDTFAVVVSDQRMPKMEGVEVLKRIKALSPLTVRMMLTGYADMKSAMRAVNDGNVFRFMAKPWAEDDLRSAIEAGLQQYELVEENRKLSALTNRQNQELLEFNYNLEQKVDERTAEVEKLNAELKSALFSTIKIMGSLSGILNPLMEGHSLRVAKVAGFIARDMGLTEQEIYDIQVSAYVHNIGALGRPGSSALDPEAGLSAKIASLIPKAGKAPLYVLHQGERFGGQGKPDGQAGEKIPLGSRVLAVASEYDRLLYLGGMKLASPLNALDEMRKEAGAAFDPAVLKSLEAYVHKYLKDIEGEFECCVSIVELKPGMILSRPIVNRSGEVLVGKDFHMSAEVLDLLWQRQLNQRPVGDIHVYRSSIVAERHAA